ncbi:MAG TPA: ribbon-helix-helix domain-containing protein [Acidobacteriaceae bacterium]|nr:ribbon-helix-helix domain-containing protein [Acidobacteriaceae bacterium]
MRSTVMETVQIVLDKKLLQAADRAARRLKRNRSALVRDALRAHLRQLAIGELELRDRQGYLSQHNIDNDLQIWESEAEWPAE